MIDKNSFGRWLKQRRKALDLTQKELAQRAGCAEITLRKVEAGDLHPSAPLVASLARALGAAEADLPDLVALARGVNGDFSARVRLLRPQRANNLPAQLTPLIGRQHDIAAVRKRLLSDGARLVTLLGPPGVGKTRLALAVAEEVLEQFEHGAFFVRLGPVSDPALVPAAIAQALGPEMSGPNPPELQLRASLEEKHLLLVLDNFEHDRGRRAVGGRPAAPLSLAARAGDQPPAAADPRRAADGRAPPGSADRPAGWRPADRRGRVALRGRGAVRRARRGRAGGLQGRRRQRGRRGRAVPAAGRPAAGHRAGGGAGQAAAAGRAVARACSGPWLLSTDGLRDVSERQRTLRGAIGWSYDLLFPAEQILVLASGRVRGRLYAGGGRR
ncbi:MAG: helix-turn-helix domain-containing protein [Anaerolineae bacterium]